MFRVLSMYRVIICSCSNVPDSPNWWCLCKYDWFSRMAVDSRTLIYKGLCLSMWCRTYVVTKNCGYWNWVNRLRQRCWRVISRLSVIRQESS